MTSNDAGPSSASVAHDTEPGSEPELRGGTQPGLGTGPASDGARTLDVVSVPPTWSADTYDEDDSINEELENEIERQLERLGGRAPQLIKHQPESAGSGAARYDVVVAPVKSRAAIRTEPNGIIVAASVLRPVHLPVPPNVGFAPPDRPRAPSPGTTVAIPRRRDGARYRYRALVIAVLGLVLLAGSAVLYRTSASLAIPTVPISVVPSIIESAEVLRVEVVLRTARVTRARSAPSPEKFRPSSLNRSRPRSRTMRSICLRLAARPRGRRLERSVWHSGQELSPQA